MSYALSLLRLSPSLFFFFFNDTATTEIYTLSLHDALPIYVLRVVLATVHIALAEVPRALTQASLEATIVLTARELRSEEHTSELQSQSNLVCRLLLEKKKKKKQWTRDS